MKNRLHQTDKTQTKTLRQLCLEANINFPIGDTDGPEIEIGETENCDVIVRNIPERSYTTKEECPKKIIELLAYEAHEWAAYEVMRCHNKHKFGLLT
jgi:hypothetical protein